MNLYESIAKESTLKESNNDVVVAMECNRVGYGPDQVMNDSMTVGELIRCLEGFDSDMKIVTSHDDGYTYGPIYSSDFREENAYDDDEDEEIEDSEKVKKNSVSGTKKELFEKFPELKNNRNYDSYADDDYMTVDFDKDNKIKGIRLATKEGEELTLFKCPKCGKEISKEDLNKYGMCKACYEASLKESNKEE